MHDLIMISKLVIYFTHMNVVNIIRGGSRNSGRGGGGVTE